MQVHSDFAVIAHLIVRARIRLSLAGREVMMARSAGASTGQKNSGVVNKKSI